MARNRKATHIPAVFPPGQTGQNAELNGHQPQPDPGEGVRFAASFSIQFDFFLWSNEFNQISSLRATHSICRNWFLIDTTIVLITCSNGPNFEFNISSFS